MIDLNIDKMLENAHQPRDTSYARYLMNIERCARELAASFPKGSISELDREAHIRDNIITLRRFFPAP